MSRPISARYLQVDQLLGRAVYSRDGRKLGRVRDLVATRRGEVLCVTGLLVGPGALLTRFGWKSKRHGTEIAWGDVVEFSSRIVVHEQGARDR